MGTGGFSIGEQTIGAIEITKRFNLNSRYELQGLIMLGYANEKIDYNTETHAGKPIKRKTLAYYLLEYRK